MLNSADKLFAELRDSSFAAVGPSLGEKAKAIQTNYQAGSLMQSECCMCHSLRHCISTHYPEDAL